MTASTFNGTTHTFENMQNLTDNTDYTSMDLTDEPTVVITNGVLRNIANAIRFKNGSTSKYYPNDFASEILKL